MHFFAKNGNYLYSIKDMLKNGKNYAFFATVDRRETFTFSPFFSKPRGATAQIAFDFVKNNSLTYAEATIFFNSGGNPWLGVVEMTANALGE